MGRAGEGDIEFRRTAWAVGDDSLRFHDEHGIELEALRFRNRHSAGHTRRSDDDARTLASGLVLIEFVDGGG